MIVTQTKTHTCRKHKANIDAREDAEGRDNHKALGPARRCCDALSAEELALAAHVLTQEELDGL